MSDHAGGITILVADDDPDDVALVKETLADCPAVSRVYVVPDGRDLLDFLRRRGTYQQPADAPRPDLILLDMQMPRMGGPEALMEIQAHPVLRQIPVVVLSNLDDPLAMQHIYNLGAQLYITKPITTARITELMKSLARYWRAGYSQQTAETRGRPNATGLAG